MSIGLGSYGLMCGRFIASSFGVIFLFGIMYWWFDKGTACDQTSLGLWHAFDYLVMSLSAFTTVGAVNSAIFCSTSSVIAQRLASLESLIGYVTLGVFITVFWTSLHEADIRVSGVRPPGSQQVNDSSEFNRETGDTSSQP